jgi:hypothetical protein
MNLNMGLIRGPENLALAICRSVHASEYINPPGGAGLYHAENFSEHCIQLTIQSFTNMSYGCGRFQFLPGLSIIDVLMWNSPEQIKCYLDTFRFKLGTNEQGMQPHGYKTPSQYNQYTDPVRCI